MKKRNYYIPKSEEPLYERYDQAVENNDMEELNWFEQFRGTQGDRQMIANVKSYEQFLMCGYSGEPMLNEHGWLENEQALELKAKSEHIIIFKDGFSYMEIMLLQHPNGMWIAAMDYILSNEGFSMSPSIWSKQYLTRRSAMNAILDRLIEQVERSAFPKNKKYLSAIKQMRGAAGQLSLFDPI